MLGALLGLAAPLIGSMFSGGGGGGGGGGAASNIPRTQMPPFDPTGGFNEATQNYQQMPANSMNNLSPYIGAGKNALAGLEGESGNLIYNPNAVLGRLSSGFQQSPGYQYNVDQATRAGNNAAAAGGFIGSPQHQLQMSKEIGGLASQDYNQYLNNTMGLYNQGMNTMQGLGQMGHSATGMHTGNLMDMLRGMAQNAQNRSQLSQQHGMHGADLDQQRNLAQSNLSYSNAANQEQRNQGMFGDIGNIAGIGGNILGKRMGWGDKGRWGEGLFG